MLVEEAHDLEMAVGSGMVHGLDGTAGEGVEVEKAQEGELAVAGAPIPGDGGEGMAADGAGELGGDGRKEKKIAEVALDEVH